jgi:hypothetical protein
MNAVGLVEEYRRALLATRYEDRRPLVTAGITGETIAAIVPAYARIAVDGATFEPDPEGGAAYLIPVRVDKPLTPEAAEPTEAVRSGAIIDLLAFHPAHPYGWALRRDAAEWLGAIEPQYLDPEPVHVWRSPLDWLRARCRGIVIISRDAASAYRICTMCRGGIIAEDAGHAAELGGILGRPWPIPQIIVRAGDRHAA